MQAEEIRGTLRNAGFTDAQVEGLTAVLMDLASKDDIRDLRVDLERSISGLRGELESGLTGLRGELHNAMSSFRGELYSQIGELRAELHREISGMWRKLALMLFAQTLTIVLSVAAIQLALG
jgi:hypothetical protein